MFAFIGGLYTYGAGGVASVSEFSISLRWLFCEFEYTVEFWSLLKVLSVAEDKGIVRVVRCFGFRSMAGLVTFGSVVRFFCEIKII